MPHKSTAPTPAETMSGAELPLISLPQGELLSVHLDDVPVLRNMLKEGIHYQPLRVDIERGEWVIVLTFEPGTKTDLHYHTGPSDVYTIKGRWIYEEYPDQVQVAGSYLYEPGGSTHTFAAFEDNAEQTVIMVRVTGTNINFAEDGTFNDVFDAVTIRDQVDRAAAEQGLSEVRYIGGGDTDFTA
jgi:2,4'-dihydroxyacetophenone dioxygenase